MSETPKPNSGTGLLPSLGLFTATMVVIGTMIGSGIFRKPGTMASQVGSAEMLIAVWVIAGVMTLLGALSNAEVAGAIPKTGGQYTYFDRIYGRFFGYLYGWTVFAVLQTGSIASIAYVFADYFGRLVHVPNLSQELSAWYVHVPVIGEMFPLKDFGVKITAVGLICILTAINYVGVRFGGLVQNIFTVAKVTALFVLAMLVFVLPDVGSISNITSTLPTAKHGFALVLAVAAAMQGAFWAYDGWNTVTYIAGEVRDAHRNLPRAIIVGMVAVMLIYIAMNLVYSYVLPIDVMAQSKLVASTVADKLFDGGGKWIALAVMISTLGTTNGTILASARIYYSMAQRNVFPRFLGNAHPRFRTPASSLVVQCVWSCLLVFSGTFDTLTDTLIFVSWIFYAAAAYGVFVLRKKEPDLPRPYRVPFYPVVPALFIICSLAYLVMTVYNDIDKYVTNSYAPGEPHIINVAFGTALMLCGVPLYYFFRRKAGDIG